MSVRPKFVPGNVDTKMSTCQSFGRSILALSQHTAARAVSNGLCSVEKLLVTRKSRDHGRLAQKSHPSRYLAIRDYCLQDSHNARRCTPVPLLRRHLATLASLASAGQSSLQPDPHAISTASRPLTAAEREWLQEEDAIYSASPFVDSIQPEDRFNWRLRAPSRVKQRPPYAGQSAEEGDRKKYIKRFHPPQVGVGLGEPFYDAIQAYKQRFLSLLEAEEAEDEAVLKERLSTWSLDRLRAEGYCLTGLSAYWLKANQFGRPVASFLLGPGLALPEHRFENGTQVLVSRIDPLKEGPVQGSVISRTMGQIRVSFQDVFDVGEGPWRLDVGRSNIIFQRMRTAIGHLDDDPQAQESVAPTPDRQFILQGTYLRDVLLRTFAPSATPHPHTALQAPDDVSYVPHETLEHGVRDLTGHEGAFKDDMRIQSWARRYAEVDPVMVEGDPVLLNVNASQRRAIAMMIGQRISLVQGPPGTGKTRTIIETIKLLKVHFEVPHPLLVCTYTNVAVDNLVEGLALAGLVPLRVGFGGKVKSSLVEHTLDYKLDTHPLKPSLDRLIQQDDVTEVQMTKLQRQIKEFRGKHSGEVMSERLRKRGERMQEAFIAMERQRAVLKGRIYAMHQEMLRDVVASADVICTTCVTSACAALKVTDFPVVFLDEASMSTEPASLIPLMKGSRHVALIGDHKQLPPVITSTEAQALGLGISLFERLTEEGVVPSVMLDTQYRMHPGISRFPSLEFYNFSLQDGTVDAGGNVSPNLVPPRSQLLSCTQNALHRPSVIFLDHAGSETLKDRSRVNLNEAHIVCSVVEDLLLHNPEMRGEDIGIIAPYVAQTSLLMRLFNTDAKYRMRFKEVLGDYRAMQLANIEIKTVDGFEGREKDVIIFSTVRNNPGGHIGFLADRRRLNVGLTRAKRGLFVVGSISTLKVGRMAGAGAGEAGIARVGKGAESWRRYAKYLAEEGLVVRLSGDALSEVLYGNLASWKARVAQRS